jgi:hypothetical protein
MERDQGGALDIVRRRGYGSHTIAHQGDLMTSPSPRTPRSLPSSGAGRLALGLVVGLAVAAVGPAASASAQESAGHHRGAQAHAKSFMAAWPTPDDEVVLPSRVAAAIAYTQDAVDQAARRVDNAKWKRANTSLAAVGVNIARAHRSGIYQMTLPAVEEAETTPGPDSVVAVLGLEQGVITNLAALFDGITASHPYVIKSLSTAMTQANTSRNAMLDAVLALDPEEAGADYADGMTDTVDGYTDEIANLTEALHDDVLAPAARTALTTALANSQATAAKVSAGFGGGED